MVSQMYTYSNLNAERKEIRVLVVHPGEKREPLAGSLVIVSLLDGPKPAYETISYVWGDPTPCRVMRVDGRALRIPLSSELTLTRIRHEDQDHTVWTDAICINQEDVHERGEQVSMMGEVYRAGTRNLIWLGESDAFTHKAVAAIQAVLVDIRKETGDNFERLYGALFNHERGYRQWLTASSGFSISFDSHALLNFFANKWFSRLWVLQEAALAPSNVVLCGAFEFDMLDIVRVARWCWYRRNYLDRTTDDSVKLQIPSIFFDYVDRDHGAYIESRISEIRLWDLIALARYFNTTEPRDKVYATLGLLRHDPAFWNLVKPDYSKPLSDVLRDATMAASIGLGTANILRDVSHLTQADVDGATFPSWVPQWHREWYGMSEDPSRLPGYFKASLGLEQQNSLHNTAKGNLMFVVGFCIDVVSSTGDVFRIERDMFKTADRLRRCVRRCERMASFATVKGRYPGDTNVLARTLTADTNAQGQSASPEDIKLYSSWMTFVKHRRPVPRMRETKSTDETHTIEAAAYQVAVLKACLYRMVFRTSTGMLGVGPQLMRKGDIVVVLYGLTTPLVFRQNGDFVHLVGECYVDGIMFGEAMRKQKEEGIQEIVFQIR